MNTRKRTSRDVDNSAIKKPKLASSSIKTTTGTEMWEANKIVARLEESLLGEGSSSDAVSMKKYMREKFDFFGVKSARRKQLCKQVLHDKDKGIKNSDLRHFVLVLWEKPQRELQYCAMDILDKHKKTFCQDIEEFDQNLDFLKELVVTKSWWDTVDLLASKIIGHLVQAHPNKGVPIMKEWVYCDNMWLRRTAIIHQLSYKMATNYELLFEFCLARCHEEEFFIRKAIGWALRAYAHTQPTEVKKFLLKNKNKLSKLSYNEASKHLSIARK